jgi:hypothetical protein
MKRVLQLLWELLGDLFAKARRTDELAEVDRQLHENAQEVADAMEKNDANRLNALLADRRLLKKRRQSILSSRR